MVAQASRRPVAAFDLENPADVSRLTDPMLALEAIRGLIILDEVQHRPDVFPSLRVLADRPGTPARFLVLGSASAAVSTPSGRSSAGLTGR
jgi:hypothetical protein